MVFRLEGPGPPGRPPPPPGYAYAAVLDTKLLASARSLFPDEYWIFRDDNAPCHRAKLVKRWMQSHRVAQMNWPAQIPDLNLLKIYGTELT